MILISKQVNLSRSIYDEKNSLNNINNTINNIYNVETDMWFKNKFYVNNNKLWCHANLY